MTPAEQEVMAMVEAGHPIDHIAIEMAEEVLRLRVMLNATQQQAVENYDMRQALLRIASEDYRGTEPTSARIARQALKGAGQ